MSDLLVTDAHDGRTLHARVGDTVTVLLEEPATSGYRWETSGPFDDGLAPAGDTSEVSGGTDAAGAATMRRLSFRAQRSGTFSLAFRLRRSWESEASALRRFHATIVVTS